MGKGKSTEQDSRLENIYEEVMRDCTEVLRGSATILMVGDPRLFLYFSFYCDLGGLGFRI